MIQKLIPHFSTKKEVKIFLYKLTNTKQHGEEDHKKPTTLISFIILRFRLHVCPFLKLHATFLSPSRPVYTTTLATCIPLSLPLLPRYTTLFHPRRILPKDLGRGGFAAIAHHVILISLARQRAAARMGEGGPERGGRGSGEKNCEETGRWCYL